MPLSEQEQRLLEEMERSLYHNDADFVATVGKRRGRPNYTLLVLGILTVVAGVAILIGGVALRQPLIGVVGFVVMFAGVLIAIRPSRVPVEESADRRASRAAKSAKPGLMDRLNDRWDRRQDGHDI